MFNLSVVNIVLDAQENWQSTLNELNLTTVQGEV